MHLQLTLVATLLSSFPVQALPQAVESCATSTITKVLPSTTYTFASTLVVTEAATTAEDLGTWTDITTIRSTKTLKEILTTVTDCIASTTFTSQPTVTVYTSATRSINALQKRQDGCTVTSTEYSTYGATWKYLPANATRTYTRFTAFSLATVHSTVSKGIYLTIGTAYTTTCKACGPTMNATSSPTSTLTTMQDARCAPTAIVSAAGQSNGSQGFGISYLNEVPYGGASYRTSTHDASACCQLCMDEEGCAGSGWDVRTNQCHLLFSATWDTGTLDCGNGALAFYDYGPNSPMMPGSGWFMAAGCGHIQYAGAKPDDGS